MYIVIRENFPHHYEIVTGSHTPLQQRRINIDATSCDVMTSHRRPYDVVSMSFACWALTLLTKTVLI